MNCQTRCTQVDPLHCDGVFFFQPTDTRTDETKLTDITAPKKWNIAGYKQNLPFQGLTKFEHYFPVPVAVVMQ